MLEDELHTLHFQIETLQQNCGALEKQLHDFDLSSIAQAAKELELTQSIASLTRELQIKTKDYEVLEENLHKSTAEKNDYIKVIIKQLDDISYENKTVKDELKTAIKTANDNLKERNEIMAELCTKEEIVNKLVSDIECLQQKVNVLSYDKLKLESEINEKNNLVEVINANLRSKEDTVKSMLEQVELLQNDLFLSKKDLEKLLFSTNEKDLYFESLKTKIEEQEEVIERLKEEITKTEVSYQNDLREANEIYNDLQRQFEKATSSEAALQSILFEKEAVFENKLVQLSTAINEYEEMITNLKISLQSKSEALNLMELKIQERTDDYESMLKQKDKEVDELLHRISNTKDTVNVLNQEKQNVALELDVKRSELAQVSTNMQELMLKLENLESQIVEKDLIKEKLNLALINCELERENFKMSFNLKVEELASLVVEIAALKETQNKSNLLLKLEKDKVLMQDNQIKSLKEELEYFRFEGESRNNVEKLLQLKENEIVALTLSLSNLKFEHEEKLNELLLNISKQEISITSLNAELQKHNAAQEIWDQEQEYLRNIISTKESDCYHISEDLKKSHQTCHQLRHEHNELKLILEDNQNAFNKNQEYIATLQLELKEKLHQIAEMESSLKASEDCYFRIESELKSMQKHCSGIEKDLKVSEERFSNIEKDFKISLESCSKFENELKVREELCSRIENDLKISKKQYSNLENDLKCKEVYCSNLEKDLIISKEQCSKVESDFKFCKERCSNFERELEEYEAFKVLNQEKISDLEEIIDDKSAELLSVKQLLNGLMSQMQQVQFEKESGNQIISELQTALRGKTNDFELLSMSFEKLKVYCDQFFLNKKSDEKLCLENCQQNTIFSIQNEQLNENNHISKVNELSNALDLKEIELKQMMELLNKKEQSLSLVEANCNELNTELASIKEVLKIKDDELLKLEKVNRNLTTDYDSLKMKTARILKKSQTMKKDLAEKQNELESLLKDYTASEKKLIELNICYEQLQKEQEMNQAAIISMNGEIITLKEVQNKEDILNASSITINQVPPSELLNIPLCDESLMKCSKICMSEPLLDSSDIGLQQNEIKELDSAKYNVIKSDSLSPETETVAEEFLSLIKSKNDEILQLKLKIEEQKNVNKKIKKKYVLLKKAEMLLSKEIKDKSFSWHHENEELKKEIVKSKQLLESSNTEKILLASKNEKILNLMTILGEDNEDFESLGDFINKSLKSSEDIDLLHNANLRLQSKYDSLENEYTHKVREIEMLQADMQSLITEKVQQKEEILSLQNELNKLSALSCVLNENIKGEKSNMKLSERTFNEQEKYLTPEEYESIKTKVYEENLKIIEEKFNKEKVQILESSVMENAELRKNCLKEKEIFAAELKSTYDSEIQLLNNEIFILQKKVDQVLLENTLKDSTEVETTVKNIDPAKQENEISDVTELKRALNSVLAKQQEAEYVRDCEKLLKEQYFSEISILKEEAICLKKELMKTQSVYDEIETIKQHKDLIIKKLKLKLKQTIAEKASLNDSISSITELSAVVEEKEAQIQSLKNGIVEANFKIACNAEEVKKVLEITSNEHERKVQQIVTEYKTYMQEKEKEISDLDQQIVKYKELLLLQNTEIINHNSEKDELIATLKEESIWLQDSMVALHQKADKYDILAQENHELKQQIQKKNEEITHIREILTLKDNELSYLSEQERLNREELSSELNKMSISLENKDFMIKNLSDKANYLQSQVIDLTSKSEHLESTVAVFANIKEALDEERNTHEGYFKEVEEIIIEKDHLIDNLKIDCNFYEEQVRTLLKGKDEVENLKKQFDELKEILTNKEDQLSQASDSLKTREGQLSNLRSEIVQRDQMIVDLQGYLQTKEVEMESSKSIAEVKETMIKQLNESVTLSNDSLETERSKAFAMLREKNLEIQEMSDKIKALETILNQQKFAHDQLLNYQDHETLDSEKSACEESFEESSRTLEELQMLRGLLEGTEQDILSVNIDLQRNYNENIDENLCINQNLTSGMNASIEKVVNIEKKECDLKEKVDKNFFNPQLVLESSLSSSTPIKNNKMLNVSVIDIPFKSLSNSCETSVTASTLYDQESESGWEISEDVVSASNQSEQVPNADLGLMKQVEDLIENIEKLSAIKERKENIITKLKLKLKRTIEEKDQLKQEAKSASKSLVDIANLQEELEILKQENICLKALSLEQNNSVFEIKKQLEQVKEHKDKVITKLKVKVKQTIKDRDQLSENLQSEIDRLSEEKDLLFNELSQNLQEQNLEMRRIEESNQALTMMVRSLESKLTEKDSAFQELKLSLNASIITSEKQLCHTDSLQKELNSLQIENQKLTETFNEKLTNFVKLQEELKYLQLENENLKETIKDIELFNEKLKSDNDEKDFQINNFEKLSIQNKLNQESWNEEKTVLEDALRIKEVTLERLLVEHQALQREFMKFKSHQLSDEQKAIEMEELNRKYQANQELLLNYQSKIKEIDNFNIQIEDIRFLFGISDCEGTLLDQLKAYKLEIMSKLKEKEKDLEKYDLEIKNSLKLLDDLMKIKFSFNATTSEQKETILTNFNSESLLSSCYSLNLLVSNLHDYCLVLKTEWDKCEQKLGETESVCLSLKEDLAKDHEVMEGLVKKLKDAEEKIIIKEADLFDTIEENQELRDELADIKEQLNETKNDQVKQILVNEGQILKNLISESCLNEKKNELILKEEKIEQLEADVTYKSDCIKKMEYVINELGTANERLKLDDSLKEVLLLLLFFQKYQYEINISYKVLTLYEILTLY